MPIRRVRNGRLTADINHDFRYNDGRLRDRVDDTKSTIAGRAQCTVAKADLDKRLKTIREESNVGSILRAKWGDISLRWERT
jgi:hypothetical protein